MAEANGRDVTLNTLHEDLTATRAEIRETRVEVRAGFADLKGAMAEGFRETRAEMRAGFAGLKTTLIQGFRSLPTRESSDEMVRLLREGNRLQETRFAQLDVRIREQHLETQQVLHALAEGQRVLVEGQRALVAGVQTLAEGQRALVEEVRRLSGEVRSLSADIKALIARLDALIRGRGDGSPAG